MAVCFCRPIVAPTGSRSNFGLLNRYVYCLAANDSNLFAGTQMAYFARPATAPIGFPWQCRSGQQIHQIPHGSWQGAVCRDRKGIIRLN